MLPKRKKNQFSIGSSLLDGDQDYIKRRSQFHVCITLVMLSFILTFNRIDKFNHVKDLKSVKSYVHSKLETILDANVGLGNFDILLALIKDYEIPVEKYRHHKGELTLIILRNLLKCVV